jgi:CubicO group peptidase (beta-lactamase class C family)
MKRLTASLLLVALGGAGAAQDGAGLDPSKLSAIRARMQEFVEKNQAAGLVALVGRRGVTGCLDAVGWQDVENKVPMKPDTLFRIASMTKPITAIAVMMLEDEGKLSVDDAVEKHLPEFKGQMLVKEKSGEAVTLVKSPRPITLKDLLTHTSGLPAPPPGLGDLYRSRHKTLAEAVLVYSQRPLDFAPGSRWSYCNTGIDTLGRVVEVASGKPFEAFLDERLFKPLGMKDTFFYPTAETLARTAVVYKKDGEKIARSDNFLGDPVNGKFPLPAGGLYSTAADIARVCRLMLARGAWEGRRILSEASVEKMTRNHTGDLKAGFTPGIVMGLGWQIVGTPEGVTATLSPGTYGHGGAFGTQYWIDPARQLYVILMVQRAGFGNGDASDLRKALQDLAVAALTD